MTERGSYPSSTHPPLPPTPEDDWFCRLRLLRSRRVGISTYNRLLAEHGTAQNALNVLPELAHEAGVKNYAVCPVAVIEAELNAGHTAGATLLSQGSAFYPSHLNDLADAPPFLWAMGDLSLLSKPMISIVGARNASSLGTRMAKYLARDLGAQGYVVVSGLARGIDAAAHIAALETGTVAVQAGGVDTVYPLENSEIALNIAKSGLRLSEQPMGLRPMARHFPVRNRIISGLGAATIVVEAAAKSGSLITARDALDQGRDVMAVPGSPLDARASGCNMLIRDGATLIRSAADVLEALAPLGNQSPQAAPDLPMHIPHVPPPTPQRDSRNLRDTAALHSVILNRLGSVPLSEDHLIREISAKASEVGPVLTELELNGEITRASGGLLTRRQ